MTLLSFANLFYKHGLFLKAIWYYKKAMLELPLLTKSLQLNIKKAKMNLENLSLEENCIDIVIPVYNSLLDFKQCLDSIKKNNSFNARFIIINDGSDVETTEYLRKVVFTEKNLLLVENHNNIGYTKTINRGMKLSDAQYVLILNSDTIVTDNWLDKMINVMKNNDKIGIIGPLSNAATWQNIPRLRNNQGDFSINKLRKNISLEKMNQIVEISSKKFFPSVPLVNGFCMMIRREVINKIGYMNEEMFPLGYGEEIDYCIRAKKAGFDLAIADNVYIYHVKTKSFTSEQRKKLSIYGERAIKYLHGAEYYMNLKKEMDANTDLKNIRFNINKTLEKEAK